MGEVTIREQVLKVSCELYPLGPTNSSIWVRSGGDLANLNTNSNGKTVWFDALKLLEKGGTSFKLITLIQTMMDDFPHNEILKNCLFQLNKKQQEQSINFKEHIKHIKLKSEFAITSKIVLVSMNPKVIKSAYNSGEVRDIINCNRSMGVVANLDYYEIATTDGSDIMESLMQYKPDIIHFSGLDVTKEILRKASNKDSCILNLNVIDSIFNLTSNYLQCVILNSCFNKEHALIISQYVPIVIWIDKVISNDTSKSFLFSFHKKTKKRRLKL